MPGPGQAGRGGFARPACYGTLNGMTDVSPPPTPDPAAPSAPGYAPPGYGYAQPAYYAPPTNTLAILALVLAFVISPGGIICGHIALSQIKRTGEGGHGLALAGLIVGYVFTGIWVLIILFYIIAAVASAIMLASFSRYY